MQWFRIDKSASKPPETGSYKDWKPEIRIEGRQQCVYCAIREPQFGGLRNFHVEHYRPKKRFAELTNTFSNLFYCCAICNSFKGDDWPNEPSENLSNNAYPDPSLIDYAEFLSVDDVGRVRSALGSGKYVIERLNLNRAQLQMMRRFIALREQISVLMDQIDAAVYQCTDIDAVREGFACAHDAWKALDAFTKAIPYESKDAGR
jgi:hypothetical protein